MLEFFQKSHLPLVHNNNAKFGECQPKGVRVDYTKVDASPAFIIWKPFNSIYPQLMVVRLAGM
jgi:hypothetical protein